MTQISSASITEDHPGLVRDGVAAPGFHRGVDFDAYVSWPAVNSSTLNGFSRTPAHVYYEMTHGGKERTEALDLGWYLHLAVLEPDRYHNLVVQAPAADRRTKVGRAILADFESKNEGKHVVDAATLQKVLRMQEAVYAHETAREFLTGRGHNEISILWEDKEHGVSCKARIDRVSEINGWPIVGDIKTTQDASRVAFGRSMLRYGYDVQAAHYLSGLEALSPIPAGRPFRKFVWLVVESEPPYCVACYEPDEQTLEEGLMKRSRYLRKWRECVEGGKWPGYPAGIEYASLPPWAFKSYIDE